MIGKIWPSHAKQAVATQVYKDPNRVGDGGEEPQKARVIAKLMDVCTPAVRSLSLPKKKCKMYTYAFASEREEKTGQSAKKNDCRMIIMCCNLISFIPVFIEQHPILMATHNGAL